MTAPRPVSYLPDTVLSIQKAGFADWKIFEDCNKNGPLTNFRRSLEWGLCLAAEFIVVFQDDIRVACGLKNWLTFELPTLQSPDIGVISLFCLGFQLPKRHGWHSLKLWKKNGNIEPISGGCALVMSRTSARSFLDSRWSGRRMLEMALADWCRDENKEFWRYHPSLVEHMGVVSSILKRPRPRKAAEFCDDIRCLDQEQN